MESARARVLKLAQAILSEEIGIIEGCRALVTQFSPAGLRGDPDAMVVVGVESETDDVIILDGRVRNTGMPSDTSSAQVYIDGVRPVVMDACRSLVQKLTASLQAEGGAVAAGVTMALDTIGGFVPTATRFVDADRQADDFEILLRGSGRRIVPGSSLERGILRLREIGDLHAQRSTRPDQWGELGSKLQEAMGTSHLIRLVLKRAAHREFGKLWPHIDLLSSASSSTASASQATDTAANKVFELVMALALLERGENLEMDDESSGLKKPDITVDLPDGNRWAFECKVMSTHNPRTLFGRVVAGAEQIECGRCDLGVVAVSFKNLLPHDSILPVRFAPDGTPELGTTTKERIAYALEQDAKARIQRMIDTNREDLRAWMATLRKTRKALVCPTVVGYATLDEGRPVPALYGVPFVFELNGPAFSARSRAALGDLGLGMRVE